MRIQDIIKPNLVGDSYVRLLTSLHLPSATFYHRFNYSLYNPVEQSFIESIAIRLVTESGENVVFKNSDITCLVILHFKKSPQLSKSQFVSCNGSIYSVLRKSKWWRENRSSVKGEFQGANR